MKYLLDTNILSETIRQKPNKNVVGWLNSVPQDQLYISVLTIGEIRKGIAKLSEGKKKQNLIYWLETELLSWFNLHIISIDVDVSDKWGYLLGNIKRPLPAIDSLIAASALTHNLMLVTRNVKDFKDIPTLELFNPWDA